MKKTYVRPTVLCEEFSPEAALCACDKENPGPSAAAQCGLLLPEIGVTLFADGWADCLFKDTGGGHSSGYCYQPGAVGVFGS
mgnify:CR=1 FL=1